MTEIDYYESVRQKLQVGRITTPNHKKIFELMKIFWNEDEIEIISHFNNAGIKTTRKELAEKTGKSEEEIEKLLTRPARNGTIIRSGSDYRLIPLLPGVFEMYFIRRKDTDENLHKVAEIYRYIFKNRAPDLEDINTIRRGFRPLLPYDSEEKLIKVDKSFDVESKVLPYEVVKDMIDKNESFAVVPCQCRLIGEYTGEACEKAPPEMGCFLTGEAAERQITYGARRLSKEEAIEFIKETEKAGLVHNTVADTSKDTSQWICNCCSCHCGVLLPAKLYHYKGVNQTNFAPEFDIELCTKCEICMEKCPNEAIYHVWPTRTDASDEKMNFREEMCIGCGTCATNCPNNAIKMVKVRDEYPKGMRLNIFG